MMAEISHGRVLTHLRDQDSYRMSGHVFCHNSYTLPPHLKAEGHILDLWDMNPETSTLRIIIRDEILKYLSRKPNCSARAESREKLARVLEEKLFARAESKFYYMDLSTLEGRLDDLLGDDRKDAVCHVSSSSIGSTTWSSEMPHNMEASSPACFHNTDSARGASNTVHFSSLNTNPFASSVLDSGLFTSHTCLPNELHRIVASVSLGSRGNAVPWPGVPGPHILEPASILSQHGTWNRHSSNDALMSPQQNTECHNNYALNTTGDKTRSSMSKIPSYRSATEVLNAELAYPRNVVEANDEAATSEGCTGTPFCGDMHFMADSKLSSCGMSNISPSSFGSSGNSEIMNPSCVEYKSAMNSVGLHSHSDLQNLQQPWLLPVSQNLAQSFYIGTQSHSSEQGHLLQNKQLNKDSQQLCQGSNLLQKQFDSLQLFQNDQYCQQQRLLTDNRSLGILQSGSFLNGQIQMNGNVLPGQVPLQPGTQQDIAVQQPPQCSIEKPSRFHLSVSNGVASGCQSEFSQGSQQLHRAHKFLFLYEHVMTCFSQEQCEEPLCMFMKQKIKHIVNCNNNWCTTMCVKYRTLIVHYRECHGNSCPICTPVRIRLKKVSQDTINGAITEAKAAFPTADTIEHKQPPLKRMKTGHPSLSYSVRSENSCLSSLVKGCIDQYLQGVLQACHDVSMPVNSINTDIESGKPISMTSPNSLENQAESRKPISKSSSTSSLENQAKLGETRVEGPEVATKVHSGVEPISAAQIVSPCEQDHRKVQVEAGKAGMEAKNKVTASSVLNVIGAKPGTPKTRGVSLLDTFTPEKIKEHIRSLQQCVGQNKAKAQKVKGVEHSVDENSCSLCGMDKLLFEPPSRYCASCSKQISPKGVYYSMRDITMTFESDAKIFCSKCYNGPGQNVKVGGEGIPKIKLEKKWNCAETDAEAEWWVQCDKCQAWQHQICALFNGRKEAQQAEYTCPNCSLEEIECGEREPFPPSMVPGAKDLPTTMLSHHIEQWLFRRLKEEQQERANSLGKNFDEVPGAEGLTVRVVSSVDKRLEVKQHFHKVFKEEKYPAEFPYKSKAILLFQKIDGADVCLFGMYVQEYGSECACPNQRRVCLSYIDSVKYFRPNIKAATGEALRTYVYHEILIGYLDYCKKRGFTSCHIWSCPSLKRDDYILYCHPTAQKMPKSDKLRDWYQTMITKATKQKVVMEHSNLYDLFFVPATGCKTKVTAVCLPYFDGDYWPGEAEILLQNDKSVSQKKGTKAARERALRAAKRDSPIGNPKDILLMHQLGQIIHPMKEDFIMIHLQHTCSHCRQPIVSGKQWVCTVCKNFQLCEGCHCVEQNLEKKDRHPVTMREKHSFELIEVEKACTDTDDKDAIIQSEIFDTRTVFLSLCQGNQYQFDTLRRAKHSTMMILSHLHTPTAPALSSLCAICHGDIDRAWSWHCMTCSNYDLCDSCYQREGAACHDHKLTSQATMADSDMLQKKEAEKKEALQIMLNVLVHASNCPDPRCSYPSCNKLKRLFIHCRGCKTRSIGGCIPCKKVWYLLQIHARVCNKLECRVPRCRDLKDHMKKKQQQSESLQRAGAKRRIMQEVGEASEGSG